MSGGNANRFDFAIAEGGVPSYMGYDAFFLGLNRILKADCFAVFSSTTLRGYSTINMKSIDVIEPTPDVVRSFYEKTIFNTSGRQLLNENELHAKLKVHDFAHVMSFNLPSIYWSAFYKSLKAIQGDREKWGLSSNNDAECAIYEAFYNLWGRHHIDYGYYLIKKGS